jgi:small-conductance mechanosensitive channel
MDIQQAINLEIFKQFEENGIEFAYPTQTLYVDKPEEPEKNRGN